MKPIYLKNVSTLKLDEVLCIGCGMCVDVCPHEVFKLLKGKSIIQNIDYCMECGACKMNCPENAIDVRTGVGCAAGIIQGFLTNSEATCDCSSGSGCC